MDHFAGLDVSVKETNVCIVDDTGSIVREVKVVSEPEALLQVLGNPIHRLKRIGHTSTSGRGLALCGLAFHNLAQGLVDPRLPAIPRRFEVFDHLGADAQRHQLALSLPAAPGIRRQGRRPQFRRRHQRPVAVRRDEA